MPNQDGQEISEEEKQKRIQNFVAATSSDETVAISKLSKCSWDINVAINSLLNDKSAFSDFQNSFLGSHQNQSKKQKLDLDDFWDENDSDENDFEENDSDENDFEENDEDS